MHNSLIEDQKEVCKKYNVEFVQSSPTFKVGIAKNVKEGLKPIHGLRHQREGDTTGWYIWAGDEPSNDPGFFLPVHVEHLVDWCPQVLKYLGLPPGMRFLIDNDYEDVWEDKKLIDVE